MSPLARIAGIAALASLAFGPAGAAARPVVPAMSLVDLQGRTWTQDVFRGRVTLVDFWATWCAPCLAELPYLKEMRRRYSRDEFEILGVSFDSSDHRTFRSWLNRQDVVWPQIYDRRGRQGEAARLFAVSAVPTTILVDDEGRIVARNLRGAALQEAVATAVRTARSRSRLTDQRRTSTSTFDAARAPIVMR